MTSRPTFGSPLVSLLAATMLILAVLSPLVAPVGYGSAANAQGTGSNSAARVLAVEPADSGGSGDSGSSGNSGSSKNTPTPVPSAPATSTPAPTAVPTSELVPTSTTTHTASPAAPEVPSPTSTPVSPEAPSPTTVGTVAVPTSTPVPPGATEPTATATGQTLPVPQPGLGSPTPTPTIVAGAVASPTPTATVAVPPTPTAVATAEPTAPVPTEIPTAVPVQETTTASDPPANDDFDSATAIGGLPFSDSVDTSGATAASNDPDMGAGQGTNGNTVWYRFTAPSSGSLQVSARDSEYDTVIAAFTGSRGSLTLVASNDDAPSGRVQSEMTFAVQAGATYHIEVAGFDGSGGGRLRLSVDLLAATVASPTPTAVAAPTPLVGPTVVSGAGSVLSATAVAAAAAPAVLPIPTPSPAYTAQLVPMDERFFAATGYRIGRDAVWDYFQRRGGVRSLGYPISREFILLGFQVQMFQRGILQMMPDGSVASMNLLDAGLMPYTRINFSTFPAPDRDLIDGAPAPGDPDYAEKAIAFLQARVPDEWEGMPVGFLRAFLSTVRSEDAFAEGDGDEALIPLLNLELWGLPTSRPAFDPNNYGFVYQRFQRGIMHFDASTGATQGLLLGDYMKSIMTGEGLPLDLEAQAKGSRFYREYDRSAPGFIARPAELTGSNLAGAFEVQLPQPVVASALSADLLPIVLLLGVAAAGVGSRRLRRRRQ